MIFLEAFSPFERGVDKDPQEALQWITHSDTLTGMSVSSKRMIFGIIQ